MSPEQLDVHKQKQKINLDKDFTRFNIINSKGMIEVSLKLETLKHVENRKLLVILDLVMMF